MLKKFKASAEHSFKKALGLPQILIVAVALLSLSYPTQILSRYRQKSFVMIFSILSVLPTDVNSPWVRSDPRAFSRYNIEVGISLIKFA